MTSTFLTHFLQQKEKIKNQQSIYELATPFPHIVIDDFLPTQVAEKILATTLWKERPNDNKLNNFWSTIFGKK